MAGPAVWVWLLLVLLLCACWGLTAWGLPDGGQHAKCRLQKTLLEETFGYGVVDGFRDSDGKPEESAAVVATFLRELEEQSTYGCGVSRILNETTLVAKTTGESFNASAFYELLHGRTLVVIGDSLGEQLYHALIFELRHLVIKEKTHNGNGTMLTYSFTTGVPDVMPYPKLNAAVREYRSSGGVGATPTRVLWCKDPMPSPWHGRDVDFYCTRPMLQQADLVLLAIGAHFKPPDNLQGLPAYYTWLDTKSAPEFLQQAEELRAWLHTHNPHARVIWRLDAHVGPIDEYNALHFRQGGRDYHSLLTRHASDSGSGHVWDQHFNRSAAWVSAFNSIKRAVARANEDYVLNHEELSRLLLKHQADRSAERLLSTGAAAAGSAGSAAAAAADSAGSAAAGSGDQFDEAARQRYWTRIHYDSLHYCAGGLFRAGNLLLLGVLKHMAACHAHAHHAGPPAPH